jgi:hypothetical protein
MPQKNAQLRPLQDFAVPAVSGSQSCKPLVALPRVNETVNCDSSLPNKLHRALRPRLPVQRDIRLGRVGRIELYFAARQTFDVFVGRQSESPCHRIGLARKVIRVEFARGMGHLHRMDGIQGLFCVQPCDLVRLPAPPLQAEVLP